MSLRVHIASNRCRNNKTKGVWTVKIRSCWRKINRSYFSRRIFDCIFLQNGRHRHCIEFRISEIIFFLFLCFFVLISAPLDLIFPRYFGLYFMLSSSCGAPVYIADVVDIFSYTFGWVEYIVKSGFRSRSVDLLLLLLFNVNYLKHWFCFNSMFQDCQSFCFKLLHFLAFLL